LAHPDRAPWPAIAERAAEQSARLEELLQQLLLLARADEQKLTAQQQTVDVTALLNDVVASTPALHVDVDVDAAQGILTVGSRDQLQRLFGNVLDNAMRYATSRVHITATVTEGLVNIEIADDGPGIPDADRERVFDRFVRLDSSRERGAASTGSTGLGLAIAREIANAHHGRITVEDGGTAGGTRVRVSLPLAAATREQSLSAPPP
jgi:signal transduction histidine kinase